MTGLIRLARRVALCGVFLCVLRGGGAVLAGPCLTGSCPGGCICVPNVYGYGYFHAQWRRWPGEQRPDINLPQAVGAEILRTPAGERQLLPGETPIEGGVLPPDTVLPREMDVPFFQEPEIVVPGGSSSEEPMKPMEVPLEDPRPVLPGERPAEKPAENPLENPPETPDESPAETPTQNPAEARIEAPVQILIGRPTEARVETPAERPVKANPSVGQLRVTPAHSVGQLRVPPMGGRGAPIEAPKQAAVFTPLLQGGWRALAEEPRGMLSFQGPAHSAGYLHTPPMGESGSLPNGRPNSGHPALLDVPVENPKPGTPKTTAEHLQLAPHTVADRRMNEPQGGLSGTSVNRPLPKTFTPKTLRANWTAALHPGFRGLPSVGQLRVPPNGRGRPRPAVYQAPAEPRTTPATGNQTPRRPDGQPAGRLPGKQQAGSPPVALDGYCPVELGEKERWQPGNLRWSVVHQGRTYLFSGPTQRQRFLAAPHRYVPAYSACDPVLLVDVNRRAAGQTDYCVICDGRLYMFSGSGTLERFKRDPQRYTVSGRKK